MVDPLTDVKTARYQPSKVKWTVKCKTCNLKKGNKNNNKEAVKQLQTYLNTRGWYNKKIDGDYGSYTEQAVKSFQTTYKLTVDGIFGPKSCNKLTNLLKGDKKKLATINKTLTDLNKRIKQNTYPYADENVDAYLILYNSFVIPPADETLDTGSETQTTTTSSTTGVSQGVVTGQKTITVNMMPSCSAHHDGYYRKQVTFLDKCPFCGSVGVLKNNPKGVYEGELTCGHCDADFCGWDGNDKMKPPRKKLTIVSSGDGVTVVSEPNTNSTNGGTTTTTTKTTNLASITLKEIFEEDKKLDEYLVHELTEVNTSEDASDLSHEATFKVRYTKERYKQLRQLRTCDLLLYRRGEVQSYIQGYLSAVKRSQQNNLPWIELTVTGYQAFLEQSVEFNATARKSELINKLCMMVGIHADLNLTGLSDDTYTIQTSSPETSSNGGTGVGGGVGLTQMNGKDTTDTFSIATYSFDINQTANHLIGNSSANYAQDTANMSAKEALLDIKRRFKYGYRGGGGGYANNLYSPQSMWNKDGTIYGNCADISRLVMCMMQVHGLRAGIHHTTNHYYNLIEVNGQTYRFDCCFRSGQCSSTYGGDICNTLTMRGGPWSN